MKRVAVLGLSVLLLGAASVSPVAAGQGTSDRDLALLIEAQGRVSAQLASANFQKSSAQYGLLAERRRLDALIADLEAGRSVDPARIETALKRARVLE